MLSDDARAALRVVSADLGEWIRAVNEHGDLSRANLEVPPTPENTQELLSTFVEHPPLPLPVVDRCQDPVDDEFRAGCFAIVARARTGGLRLHLIALAGADGEVNEPGNGTLEVFIGLGTADPFGLAAGEN